MKKPGVPARVAVVCLAIVTVGSGGLEQRVWAAELSAEKTSIAPLRELDHNPMAKATAGKRYEALVPDTLDLAARMGVALNALTNVWFPDEKWGLGFKVDFSRRPAVLKVNHLTDAYLNIPPKFIEAMVLCRLASGKTHRMDVDQQVIRAQLALLGEDGLTYCPTDTFKDLERTRDSQRPFSEIWGEGRMLLALSMLAQVDDDPRWKEIGKRKIDRLLSLSRKKETFRFLWHSRYQPGAVPPADADEPGDRVTGLYAGVIRDPALRGRTTSASFLAVRAIS